MRTRLGCPDGPQQGVQGEWVLFEHGRMLWRPDTDLVYVLFAARGDNGWGAFAVPAPASPAADACHPAIPAAAEGTQVVPPGRFGLLWCANPWLQKRLGWVIMPTAGAAVMATPYRGAVQDFQAGTLLWDGQLCFVLRTDDMSWVSY